MVIAQRSAAHQIRWVPVSEEIVFGVDKARGSRGEIPLYPFTFAICR